MNKIEERNKKRIEKRRAKLKKEKEKAKKPKVDIKGLIKNKITSLDYKKIALLSALGIVVIVAVIFLFNIINEKRNFARIEKTFDDNGYTISFMAENMKNRYDKNGNCVDKNGATSICSEETYVGQKKEYIFIDIINKTDTSKMFTILINEETGEKLLAYSMTLNPGNDKGEIIYQYTRSSDNKTKYAYKSYYKYSEKEDRYADTPTTCYYVINVNSLLHEGLKTTCDRETIEDIKSQIINPTDKIVNSLELSFSDFFLFGNNYTNKYIKPFTKKMKDSNISITNESISSKIKSMGYTITNDKDEYYNLIIFSNETQTFTFDVSLTNGNLISIEYQNKKYGDLKYEYLPFVSSALTYQTNISDDCVEFIPDKIIEVNSYNTCSAADMENSKKMHKEYTQLLTDLDISYARLETFILAQIK